MKKNIWIWNHYATDMFNKKGGRHYWFAENLVKQGYKPTIFCASTVHNSNENIDTGKCIYISDSVNDIPFVFVRTPSYKGNGKQRIKNMLAFYQKLFPVANEYAKVYGKPDVILASSVHPLTLVAGIKIAKKFNIPCICEVRDLWPESFVAYDIINKNNPILKVLYAGEKWIYKNADQLIFTMEGGKEYIIDKGWDRGSGGSIDLQKVHHINNGVDLEVFKYNKKYYILDDEDLKNDNFYKVVYVGSLRKANDSVWRLIQVAESFKEKGYSDIKILMYGDGSERKKIESYCKEKKLDNVRIKGYVDKKYIPYILSQCDLNVLNCSSWSVLKYGGSQNKLFDYLASGHPIISGENSKYSIVKKYNCGISKEFENLEALEKAILDMKALDSNSKENMNVNILKVANEYDYTCLTKKLIQIIESSDVLNEKENINFSSTY